ncbi:MAG TPA: PA14 domain-containing protein, partial [Acidimicrobiales bacterium]|nr:PA14 domain-containing protein [Acidimicrobiales bacterium]
MSWTARRLAALVVLAALVGAGLDVVVAAPPVAAAGGSVRPAGLVSPPLTSPAKDVPSGDYSYAPSLGAGVSVAGKPLGAPGSHGGAGSVLSGRTATSSDYLNSDGTHTLAVSAGAVNYQDSSGAWHPFDLSLAAVGSSGRLAERAGPAPLDAAALSDGGADLLRASGSGWSAGIGVAGGAAGVAGVVTGSTVRYDGIAPGLDLWEVFGRQGVEDVLVAGRANPTGSWVLSVTLAGATLEAEPDGSVAVMVAGRKVGALAGGIAQDSATPSAATPVSLSVLSASSVAVSVSPTWLNDAARVFAVRVDPTLNVGPPMAGDYDAYAQQNNPSTNYNGGAQYDTSVGAYVDVVGYPVYPSVQDYTFQHFDMSQLAGKTILGAQWKDWVFAESGANAPFTIWQTQGSWTAGSVTWNTLPGHWATPRINDTAPASGNWAYAGCQGSNCAGDVLTALVAGWAKGSTPNNGLDLDTAGTDSMVKLGAVENGGVNTTPTIFVTYDTPPPPSAQVSPANAAVSMSATPVLSTTPVVDADGDAVSYWFRVSTNPDGVSGQVVNSGWVTSTTWTPPPGTLSDGTTYYWQAYTWDSVAGTTSVPASGRFALKVNLRLGAQAATPTDSEGPLGVNLANGNVFYSQDGPSFDTVGGALGMHYSYNSAAPDPYGLVGSYYANCNPASNWSAGQPTAVRSDPAVNFNWGTGSPMPGVIGATNFCVEWKGYLTVPYAQSNWYVGGYSDDGIRVWVNGAEVVNDWQNQAYTETWSAAMNLPAAAVPITVDYYQAAGNAAVDLQEAGPVNYGDIPASWLSAHAPDMPPGWQASLGGDTALAYTAAKIGADDITLTGPDGDVTDFTKTTGTSGWAPPPGDDDVLSQSSTGTVTVTGADGIIYTFNPSGQLTGAISALDDAHRAAPSYTYSTASAGPGQLSAVNDPVSRRSINLEYASDPTGASPACANPPAGFSYPPAGSLCEVDYWDGTLSHLYYNSNGQLAEIADPGGAYSDFAYTTTGRLAAVRDPLAADEVVAGQRSDDATVRTAAAYNPAGQVTSVVEPAPSAGAAQPEHDYLYGAGQTQVKTVGLVMANGYSSKVTYNNAGQTLTDTDEAGLTTTHTWDGADNPLSTVEATGLETTTVYNQIFEGAGAVDDAPTDTYGPAPSTCFSGQTPNGTCTNPPVPHESTGYDQNTAGLAVAYWANPDMTGAPAAHNQASNTATAGVETNFAYASPAPGIPVTAWASQDSGTIVFPQTGTYSLRVYARGGARLWINDADLADTWSTYSASGTYTPTVSFAATAGVRYRVRVDFTCANGCNTSPNPAAMTMYWTPPGSGETPVPLSALSPAYGLATSHVDADGHKTTSEYPNPWLGVEGAGVADPGGANLRSTTSHEAPGVGYGRQSATRLPKNTYTGTVLADHPADYWRLGEAPNATTAADTAGANAGTYTPSMPGAAGPHPDDPQTSATFDGTSGYVALPSGYSWMAQGLTMDAWVDPAAARGWQRVIEMGTGAGTNNVALDLGPSGQDLNFTVYNNGAGQSLNVADALSVGAWQHVAVTFEPNGTGGGSATVYRNGTAVGTEALSVAPAAVTYTQNAIGKSNWSSDPLFQGQMADVAIYPAVLGAAQVANHYSAGTATTNAVTDAYYADTATPPADNCADNAGVNQAGLLASETSAAGSGAPTIVHQYAYDAAGRTVATRISTDATWSCTVYDPRGRVTQTTNSAGAADNFNYSTPGTTVETYTDSSGYARTVTTAADLLGRTTSYTDPSGTVTTTAYDQAGRTTSTARQLPGQSAP